MLGHPDRHPFVARERELAVLHDAVEAARGGVSQLVVVRGPAGIGKTTLCSKAAAHAAADGVSVAWGRAWGHGGAPALWPWSAVLTDLVGPDAGSVLGGVDRSSGDEADRFARFVAVAELLAGRSERVPTMIVLDDTQLADAASLLLARFVAGWPGRNALTIVLARRSGGDEPSDVRRLLDEIERTATPIALQPFEADDIADLLAAHGRPAAAHDLVPVLRRLTGGNPYLLDRALAGSPADDDGQAVDYLISRSLDELAPEQRDVLALAAILGMEATTGELAALVGGSPDEVIEALARTSAAGLVDIDGAGWRFTHDLVRVAALEVLTPAETMEAHARALDVIPADTGPAAATRRAHHATRAASRSPADAARAVAECRVAAAALGRGYDYERAATLLGTAVTLHEEHQLPERVGIVLEWADALLVCGRLEDARRAYGRAVDVAEAADWASRARAALGLGGVWVNEHRGAVDRRRVLELQRAALDDLPPEARALRARLEVRLAAEAVYDGRPVEPALAALGLARAADDDHVLAEALSLTHHALLAPEHLEHRAALADELIAVATRCGDDLRVLFGLLWKSVDEFLAGAATAERTLSELRTRAHAVGCRSIGYVVAAIDVMRLIRAGRLAEAESAAHDCFELGIDVGEADATGYYGAHLLTIRWLEGRDAELLDLAREIADSSTLVEPEFSYRAAVAAIAARAGRLDEARSMLGALGHAGLDALPRSSTWLTGIANLAEAAAVLGDGELARDVYSLLLPFADRPVMPSLAIACFGSAARPLGLAAMTAGDLDAAVAHLERAVEENVGLGNRPLTAIARADLASALVARDRPGDRQAAGCALALAIEAAADIGMHRRAGEWTERAAAIAGPADPVVLRRDGDRWLLGSGSGEVELPDLVGVGYLGLLLDRPGEEVSALELCGGTELVGAAHELVDRQTLRRYRHRVNELDAELEAARSGGLPRLVHRLERERDALRDELSSVVGRAGRPRRFADPSERARTAVRKAITRAIDVIADTRPDLAEDLRASVTTGRTCTYRPDLEGGRRWVVGP